MPQIEEQKLVVAKHRNFSEHLEHEDHICPICREIMVEPCKLPCNHYFCCQCIKWSFIKKTDCALCRAVPGPEFKITIDKEFQEFLQQAYTDEYNIMHAELTQAGMLNEEIFGIQFTVGNKHKLIENPKKSNSSNKSNKHQWTVFLELAHP